jgi:hypothetical protein
VSLCGYVANEDAILAHHIAPNAAHVSRPRACTTRVNSVQLPFKPPATNSSPTHHESGAMAASRVAAAGHHSGAQAAPGSEPRSDPQTPGAGQLQAQDAAIHVEEFGAHGQGGEERPLLANHDPAAATGDATAVGVGTAAANAADASLRAAAATGFIE